MQSDQDQIHFAVNRIANASTREWPDIFEDLRRRKRLFEMVHHLNRLLEQPAHRELAQSTLRKLGLHHSG
jgi:hypothetical protein